MSKCYLHGETAKEKPKPLKSHPGFPDSSFNYQQSLSIILTPNDGKKQKDREKELLEKIKQIQGNNFFLAQQIIKNNEVIKKMRKEVKMVGAKNFFFDNQQLNKDIAEVCQLALKLQQELTLKKQNEKYYISELDRMLALLTKPKSDVGTQTDIESRDMDELEFKSTFLAETELELPEIKAKHSELAIFFKKLGLFRSWEYLNGICQDYFATIESELEEAERERERRKLKIEELEKKIKKLKEEREDLIITVPYPFCKERKNEINEEIEKLEAELAKIS